MPVYIGGRGGGIPDQSIRESGMERGWGGREDPKSRMLLRAGVPDAGAGVRMLQTDDFW